MTCEECQDRLPGLLVEALPEDESELLRGHLESCQECSARLESLRAQMTLMRGWGDQPAPSDLTARTLARLAAEPVQVSWWSRLASAVDEALRRFGAHRPNRLTGLATVAVAVILLIPVLSPNWTRGRSSGAVTGCRQNLRLLSKALDRYAADHQGRYPSSLLEMKPTYVKLLPECPHAGLDTYGPGYSPAPDGLHYALVCRGRNHGDAGLPTDQPRIEK